MSSPSKIENPSFRPFADPTQYNWRHHLALWAEMGGLKVDSIPFSFEGHRYLFPIFMDTNPQIVWMKSAQMGATIWMLLRAFHQSLYYEVWGFNTPIKVGFFFPEGPGLNLLVKGRVEPIMRNCAELEPYAKEKSRSWKPVGDSALYFLYMGGTSSKDSTPLMSIFFDEVRLMDINAVEQAKERVSHSDIEYIQLVSTAGYPECFSGDTAIIARDILTGKVSSRFVGDFVTKGCEGWEVLSYGVKNKKKLEWRKVLGAVNRGPADVYQVTFSNGRRVKCTPEHRFAQLFRSNTDTSIVWVPLKNIPLASTWGNCFSNETILCLRDYDFIGVGCEKRGEREDVLHEVAPSLGGVRIESVEELVFKEDVFDIQVEGNSNFFLADSGCLVHNSDIHAGFLDSDQKWFTTVCDHCGYEQVLCLEFPDCIAEHQHGPRAGQSYYICKSCRLEIKDPQKGLYVPHGDPKHPISGYQVSQLLSSRKSASDIMNVYRKMTNKKEFFNAKLGIPYIDEENRPLVIEMLDNNVDPLLEWGPSLGVDTYMGVDQMSGENYVFVVSRSSIGEVRRILWFEIINDRKPFKRTGELMDLFSVKVCVCDAEPNTNDSLAFAKYFGKRVFLAKYGEYEDMIRWKDSWRPKKEHRKADPSTYHQYRIFLDKFKSVGRTLDWVRYKKVVWPDPTDRIQHAFPYKGGRYEEMPIMLTHAYPMFCSAIKERVVKKEEESSYTWRWNFLGCDPHALMALDYALRASERKVVTNPVLS